MLLNNFTRICIIGGIIIILICCFYIRFDLTNDLRVSGTITSEDEKPLDNNFGIYENGKHADTERAQFSDLPPDLFRVVPWTPYKTDAETKSELEMAFRYLVTRTSFECIHRIRYGNMGDGGWDVCMAGPYKPKTNNCLIYSFGIANDMTFDEKITKHMNCTLRAFDPTIPGKQKPYQRGNIYFYPLGLHGSNTDVTIGKIQRPVRTLDTLRKQFLEDKKVIDYLKIDIEGSEWSALTTMFKEGSLPKYVKQMGIEFHAFNYDKFKEYIDIIQSLERNGFRKWYHHWNENYGNATKMPRCIEVYYININFLKPDT